MKYRQVIMHSKVTLITNDGYRYDINKVNSVVINEGWSQLSPTAELRLPDWRSITAGDVEIGSSVFIYLGYDDSLDLEFEGYVTSVEYGNPTVISCEGESWQLKQLTINGGKGKSWDTITLKDVIEYLVPGTVFGDIPVTTFSPFRIRQDVKSVAEALQKLRDEYRLAVYFRGKTMYCGLPYTAEKDTKTTLYDFRKNALRGNLKWIYGDQIKVKVRAISYSSDNKRVEVSVGEEGGNTTTLHFPVGLQEAELRKLAEEELRKLKFDGYRGEFIGFGVPKPEHSTIVRLSDNRFPERIKHNAYFIDFIKKTYDYPGGFRRHITLGSKAA